MVKAGDVVKVRVVEVDVKRKRIGLSMRKDDDGTPKGTGSRPDRRSPTPPPSTGNNAMAAALAAAMKRR